MSSHQKTITIAAKDYRLTVEQGQDSRIEKVAGLFNDYIDQIKEAAGTGIDRDQMIVLAGMLMADEHLSLKQQRDGEKETIERYHDRLAERIESLMAAVSE